MKIEYGPAVKELIENIFKDDYKLRILGIDRDLVDFFKKKFVFYSPIGRSRVIIFITSL